jgi:hypothetical protein
VKRTNPKATAAVKALAENGVKPLETIINGDSEAYLKNCEALNYRQRVFAEAYASKCNGVDAAIRAGYSSNRLCAANAAARNLKNPAIKVVIDYLMKKEIAHIRTTTDSVLETIEAMAKADVNDIMELRRLCCRYCYGTNFVYQETPAEQALRLREHDLAVARAEKFGDIMPRFDNTIELGYNGLRDPHPECPECWGAGKEQIFFHDTRTMSLGARALYSGAQWGRDGLKVTLLSKDAAIDRLAKHHKLYEDKVPTVMLSLNAYELNEMFAVKMRQAHERMAAMKKERAELQVDG